MKNQKGVSLITLIITIIVVIILAVIILRSGASDAPDQAAFSAFTSEMGDLQDAVKSAMLTAKGSEAIRGNNRSEEQLYNFVARGGYEVLTEDATGDAKWLIQSDAELIPCTLINADEAEESIGTKLPDRKVETYKGTNQKMSFFVTPKGNVFCWPPYLYDGKSYVTADVTVKSDNTINAGKGVMGTDEMEDVTATEKNVVIVFANGEYVTVVNEGTAGAEHTTDKVYKRNFGAGSGDGSVANNNGVWYVEDSRESGAQATPSYRGFAAGYEFGQYYNNK